VGSEFENRPDRCLGAKISWSWIPSSCEVCHLVIALSTTTAIYINSCLSVNSIQRTTKDKNQTRQDSIITMPVALANVSEANEVLSKNTYVFVDFWATWCPPCRAVAPVFEQLSAKNSVDGKFAFAKVDVDQARDIATKYNITAMPTFILFKDGVPQKGATIQGADMRKINALIQDANAELSKAAEAESAKEAPVEDVPTVSGSYTVSSNPSWKMAL
jgi:thioredoxin 1